MKTFEDRYAARQQGSIVDQILTGFAGIGAAAGLAVAGAWWIAHAFLHIASALPH